MNKLTRFTDEELVQMYVQGNNRAFDELLARTQTGIFSYIIFIVHNEEVANDLFQETFLKAITKLREGKYVTSGKFNAWLIRIAHNTVMDWYRRQKAANIVDTAVEDMNIAQMTDRQLMETSKEDMMANSQVLNDVRSLMAFLPDTQREVVQMRFYQNYSFKEIAEITGVSINTSLGRMRYALINMRRLARENHMQLQFA
ncbi:MAG: sigma-70 family RNA polymerase sigma factor [Prevotella sp.]|uniref:RNA polymerase subunit sigma-24 n=1 Tax=uncultured Prevotella sp. TaxID=159272 RepID=A0A6G8F0U7_9BACT|nr:sigma-70 family RNA polymerase sigma factor [Prevotella sp.]QIM09929.1 RNA polymerase subunit sigma-24 [uncultured Prevotella sp.]